MSNLLLGAAEARIHFEESLFPTPGEKYTGIHDDPSVHAFCFEQTEKGKSIKFVLAVMDLVNYPDPNELIKNAAKTVGCDTDNVFIHCNHTLATPHAAMRIETPQDAEYDREYRKTIINALNESLKTAISDMRPVKIGVGNAMSNVNVNRVVKAKGGVWQGTNESGFSDHTIPVICVKDSETEECRAILYSVNMAAGVLEGSRCADGGRQVSADIAGASERYLKEIYPKAVCAYCIGASSDQWQELRTVRDFLNADGEVMTEDCHENGFIYVDALGRKLASSITAAILQITCTEMKTEIIIQKKDFAYPGQKPLSHAARNLGPGKNIIFERAEDVFSELSVIRLGDITILAIHPEIDSKTLVNIRKGSSCDNLFLIEFTNGDGGYMAEKEIYDGCGYQARKTSFFKGSAELFEQNAIGIIRQIQMKK